MNRKQLLEHIRNALGGTATHRAAELALNSVIRAMQDGLREDGEVKLARFGTFRMRQVAARRLLLPGSNSPMQLPSRRVLRFTPTPSGSKKKR
ncbi:MAG: HU family DNA-binding protein [Akkermansia sp.]|nr:HU family DNA-binding protein [Akkermansia sp.]